MSLAANSGRPVVASDVVNIVAIKRARARPRDDIEVVRYAGIWPALFLNVQRDQCKQVTPDSGASRSHMPKVRTC